jgi:protein tyrosine phosphatase (PTP) superfamily phosphohydrolase (DUF442 family)
MDRQRPDTDSATTRRQGTARSVVAWRLGWALLGLLAVACAYRRVGYGWLTYVGIDVRPRAAALEGPSSRELATPESTFPGVPNFAEVSPELYRGAQPTAAGFRELRRRGARTIVSLRETRSDRGLLRGTGLAYVHIPIPPASVHDREVVSFLRLLDDPGNLPIFVHCQMGSDRTGTMCAAYRIVRQGWAVDDALKELPRFGFHEVWPELPRYLTGLDAERLRGLVAQAPATPVEAPR